LCVQFQTDKEKNQLLGAAECVGSVHSVIVPRFNSFTKQLPRQRPHLFVLLFSADQGFPGQKFMVNKELLHSFGKCFSVAVLSLYDGFSIVYFWLFNFTNFTPQNS